MIRQTKNFSSHVQPPATSEEWVVSLGANERRVKGGEVRAIFKAERQRISTGFSTAQVHGHEAS